jgi:hypothetical protein
MIRPDGSRSAALDSIRPGRAKTGSRSTSGVRSVKAATPRPRNPGGPWRCRGAAWRRLVGSRNSKSETGRGAGGKRHVSSADAGHWLTRGVVRPLCLRWRPGIGTECCVRISEKRHLPRPHGAVRVGGGEQLAVRAECHPLHVAPRAGFGREDAGCGSCGLSCDRPVGPYVWQSHGPPGTVEPLARRRAEEPEVPGRQRGDVSMQIPAQHARGTAAAKQTKENHD